MYTGSGCGDYLEAGVMDSQVAPAGYSNYVEVRLPGHSPAQSFYSGSPTATIFYCQGTSVFGASFSNPPNPNNDVASYNFSPDQKGCIEEAGEFVWSAISNNDAGWNALSAQTSILVQLIGGGSVTTFGNYVIDNPCNLFPTYNCMNGQFTNSSTGWNAAVG